MCNLRILKDLNKKVIAVPIKTGRPGKVITEIQGPSEGLYILEIDLLFEYRTSFI